MATFNPGQSPSHSQSLSLDESVDPTQRLSESDDEREGVELLTVGVPFDYTVPHFPVITCKLRQITFRVELSDGRVSTYDGFIRDDASLGVNSCPALIHVKDYCFVKVDEFCKGAPAHHLNHPEGVYLVWKWEWMSLLARANDFTQQMSDLSEEEQSNVSSEGPDHDESNNEHTVLFKCIGATRDRKQQSALEKANKLLRANKNIRVALFPEPRNPVDAKAIAIKCQLDDNEWHRVGYIVREALDDVHRALQDNAITSISFGWVKFRIDFHRSGPGFYAAIAITHKGCWSTVVCNCASKM